MNTLITDKKDILEMAERIFETNGRSVGSLKIAPFHWNRNCSYTSGSGTGLSYEDTETDYGYDSTKTLFYVHSAVWGTKTLASSGNHAATGYYSWSGNSRVELNTTMAKTTLTSAGEYIEPLFEKRMWEPDFFEVLDIYADNNMSTINGFNVSLCFNYTGYVITAR